MSIYNPSELLNSKVSDLVKHLASELKRFSGIDLFDIIPENYSVVMTMEDHVTLEISKANDMILPVRPLFLLLHQVPAGLEIPERICLSSQRELRL